MRACRLKKQQHVYSERERTVFLKYLKFSQRTVRWSFSIKTTSHFFISIKYIHNLTDFFVNFSRQGKNACSKNPCSHICVPLPEDKYTCLCPDGLKAVNNTNDGKISCRCPDGSNDVLNGTCPSHDGTCR